MSNRSYNHTRHDAPEVGHIVLISMVGMALRFAFLGRKSLWLDEAATYSLCRLPLHEFARAWWAHEANMTAYYALMRAWLHLGTSEWMIRFPSALFGALSVPVMYILARRILSVNAAWTASLLLAVNPAHVEYSQEARSYAMTVFLVLLASLFFVRAVEEGKGRDWTAYVVVGALAVYAHFFATLVLAAHFVSLFARKGGSVRWRQTILALVALAALSLPAIFFVLFRGETMDLYWLAPVGARTFWKLAQFYMGGGAKIAVALVLAIAGLWAAQRLERWRAAFVLLWLALPIVVTFVASLHRNVFSYKYLLISLPAALLLCAWGAANLRREVGWALVAILVVASLITVVNAYRKPHEDWRGLNQLVAKSFQPGDAITFYPPYARNPFDYYHQRTGPAELEILAPTVIGGDLTEDVNDIAHPENLVQGLRNPRIWVVLYGDEQSRDFQAQSERLVQALPAGYRPALTKNFGNLQLELYQPQS